MLETVKQFEDLLARINSTWQLLKLDDAIARVKELDTDMQRPDFWNNQETAKRVSREREELHREIETWQHMKTEVEELLSLCSDLIEHKDEELRQELESKIGELEKKFQDLEFFLLLGSRHDRKNAIVAVHAGSGGTEAQDWAEMLLRMVFRYSEKKGWVTSMLDESRGGETGIKSALFRVEGRYAYGHLKSEHGTHRLVRISPFDAEQMRHTSFALIEVLPEIEESDDLAIDPTELRIDTYRSGGAGGQHVNKTESAVRITHVPTGLVAACQNERSQQQNKETAMRLLKSKLQKLEEEKEEDERRKLRGEFKSPEWGSQIRSYVLHPYKMVKDLRTRFETKDPDDVLNGNLDPFVEAYLRWLKGKG